MARQSVYALVASCCLFGQTVLADVTFVYEFAGGVDDGSQPLCGLTLSGSTLFGTTWAGGYRDEGTVFSVNTDGTGFTLLHEFAGLSADPNEGSRPRSAVTLVGSTLFGTTELGGRVNRGTIFSLNTDGTGFTTLHDFDGGPDNGRLPRDDLTLSGSTLFGTTVAGGDHDKGTIFSVNTDGTGFTLVHEFAGAPDDGRFPGCALTLSGSTLFGTTTAGGDSDNGTIFSLNTDGTGYQLLYEFADNEGYPPGTLTLSGSTLFGVTRDPDTVFSLNTDGTGYQLLHEFAGNDGYDPNYALTVSGSTLFGMTQEGGGRNRGTVYSLSTDGTDFTPMHWFPNADQPRAGLTLAGSTLFGTTQYGGSGHRGTVFSMSTTEFVPEPGCVVLMLTVLCVTGLCRASRFGNSVGRNTAGFHSR